jgi:hypothetical protein
MEGLNGLLRSTAGLVDDLTLESPTGGALYYKSSPFKAVDYHSLSESEKGCIFAFSCPSPKTLALDRRTDGLWA